MINRDRTKLANYSVPFGGEFISFPGDVQALARSLNVDMETADRAVASDQSISDAARQSWNDFFGAWQSYFKPIDASWSWNPVGAAAFADPSVIEDWRKRLGVQENALKAAGATNALPDSPAVPITDPFAALGSSLTSIAWILGGVAALVLIVKLVPSRKR